MCKQISRKYSAPRFVFWTSKVSIGLRRSFEWFGSVFKRFEGLVRRYLAGALDAGTGRLTWVKSDRKNSLLFIALLRKLAGCNPKAEVIHMVLDNFKIHESKAARAAVKELNGRVALHFLPPYCPDDNKIERVWLDVHGNVTRNHRCAEMPELMANVESYLRNRNNRTERTVRRAA